MDREYRTPESAARVNAVGVHQALSKVLRRGFEERPFLLRMRFRYDSGGEAPLLFIGRLNRAWSDYINANARANDLVSGTCTLGRSKIGRTLVKLKPQRGRGTSSSTQLNVNRVLRALNAEVVFVSEAGDAVAEAGAKPTARAAYACW